jgi:hypothetical protein
MLELNDRLAKQQAMRAKFGRTLDRSGPIVGDGRGLKLGRYRKLSCGAFCGMRGGFGRQLSSSHRFSVAGSRGCGARRKEALHDRLHEALNRDRHLESSLCLRNRNTVLRRIVAQTRSAPRCEQE